MGAFDLGKLARQTFPAHFHLAAADDAERSRLRGSSSAVSRAADSLYLVSRYADRRESSSGLVRYPRRLFVLLAGRSSRNSPPADLADCAPGLLGAVSLSAEYDQGATVRNHLPGRRHALLIQEKVLAAAAAGFRVRAEL